MNQMDLEFSINRIKDFLPNSTKCMTWQDVKASHETDNPEVVVRIEDVYGMLILLAAARGSMWSLHCLNPGTLDEGTKGKVNGKQSGNSW